MIVLNCNSISFSFGINKILDNISFSIQTAEKVGFIGVNGAGKSTLFRIIAGIMHPDSGEIFTARNHKIGFLQQNSGLNSTKSIWDELISTYSHLIKMEERLKTLEEQISKESDSARSASLLKEYSSLSDTYAISGGYEYNSMVKGVLKGLGFSEEQFHLRVEVLSGGQKTRLALAKILLEEPDILLMDEPTNHLDIDALEWLEEFLKSYKKCVLIISHDRYFLDSVTTKTIEIENNCCTVHSGNYTSYMNQKAIDREIQQKHYDLQQKEISRMEAFIVQQKRWNREKNIIAAESRQKAIDRMVKLDQPKNLPDKIKISFRKGIVSGNDVLFVENLTKGYPSKPLFSEITFDVKRNERIFLLGPNGCGKSTLLKILAGKLEKDSGIFEYGHKVELGYYDQEQSDLDDSNTIIDEIWNSNEKLTQTDLRNSLAKFLFKGEDVFKSVSVLSGGEKSRVSLLKLILSGANFMLLDEPTNHLDINSREILEKSLQEFEGTLLIVSHDRYLINKLSTRILELSHKSVKDYKGDYSFYLEQRNKAKASSQTSGSEETFSTSKLERIASKEEKARQRKLEKQFSETEQKIGQIEQRLGELESEMEEASCDHQRLTDLYTEQDGLKKQLENLYELWEQLASEKEI